MKVKKHLMKNIILIFIPQLNLLIEYDGEYHYFPYFGLEKLLKCKKSDYLKNKFCRENKIRLLRIPYWEFHQINNILKYDYKRESGF